ncbi:MULTISPECIES: diaminopimelate decarboxylase [unclassified Moraxella]|uniref:diaminopimelate decarboxylase n=1 Tax=unclassified Moraxella TaxID=2685852 RepID=UPI003AF671A2
MTINTDSLQPLNIDPIHHVSHLPYFDYQDKQLAVEGVLLNDIAKQFGTPCYVYSGQAILDAYQHYVDSFAEIDTQVCYAVKANSNLAVLQLLAKQGAGFDIVTGGELARALKAGADPSKIVFSGLGKTADDIKTALSVGIACFNVESEAELYRISQVAQSMGKTAPISLRVNPNVDAKTHPYISTGLKENKFGITAEDAPRIYGIAKNLPNINIVGIDCHIGSQLTEAQPFVDALDKVIELINQLKADGIELEHIDLGGGLGVQYVDEQVATINEFAQLLLPKLKTLGLKLYLEPGRSIVANAGVLLTKVDILKPTEHKNFAIVDGAMNDLIRPSLYQSVMAVIPTQLNSQAEPKAWDIVGAICETGDFLAKNRELALSDNDVLAMTGAGAYGFTMSSNYNSRPRACEILVKDGQAHVIRERETVESLWEKEYLL